MRLLKPLTLAAAALIMSGCAATKTAGKIVAAPIKITAKTTEIAGKGIYGTTKFAGKTVAGTGVVAGKTVIGTGKLASRAVVGTGNGIYYMGTTPVRIANGALDSSAKVLEVTTQAVDLSGQVVKTSRQIQAFQLENELLKYRGAKNVMDIAVNLVR